MAGFGETLRQARAHKSVTLKEAEQSTRINRHHLSALEDEDFEALPPLIYQRGIVRNYSVYLDLDPGKMLALFEEAHGTIAGPVATGGVIAVPPIDMPSHWAPNFAIIAFSVVLSAIVFAWVYSAYVAPSNDVATATLVVPTMTPINSDIAIPTDPAPTATKVPTQAPSPTTTAVGANQASATIPGRGDNQRAQSQTQAADQTAPTAAPATDAAQTSQIEAAPTATVEQTVAASDNTASRNKERLAAANASGAPVGGILITANTDITLTVTVDGTVEFDGNLAAGASTSEFEGTNFQVTTSSGTNTVFTNACGDQFNMGYEVNSVTYTFPADGTCTPQ